MDAKPCKISCSLTASKKMIFSHKKDLEFNGIKVNSISGSIDLWLLLI